MAEQDKRLMKRLIRKGELTQKEYEKVRAALPDLADQAEPMEVQLGPVEAEEEETAAAETPAAEEG